MTPSQRPSFLLAGVLLFAGCSKQEPSEQIEPNPSDGGRGGSSSEVEEPDIGEFMQYREASKDWQLPAWKPYTDDPSCVHEEVRVDCTNGFCKIPAGCAVLGSPEDEYGRGDERLTTVHFTHGFEIGQTEFTMAEWAELGFDMPTIAPTLKDPPPVCTASDCPVEYITWYEAMMAANAFSAKRGLPECYVLNDCNSEPGGQMGAPSTECASVEQTVESIYECRGYRLPTEFEWEYAARAGTQTAFYAGEITNNGPGAADVDCYRDEVLEQIGWYCANSKGTMPVARKRPNQWGLYDVAGNVMEYTSSPSHGWPPGPLTNPYGAVDNVKWSIVIKSGWVYVPPVARSALSIGTTKNFESLQQGFRLARTLFE